jgi:hypothetical protein
MQGAPHNREECIKINSELKKSKLCKIMTLTHMITQSEWNVILGYLGGETRYVGGHECLRIFDVVFRVKVIKMGKLEFISWETHEIL